MSLTELAVKRPTALVAIFALLVGLGVMGYVNLGADLFPSTNTPFVGVYSSYPGSGSKEIETSLVKPMEDAVSGLAGIKTIKSTSGEGYGLVVLQFTMDTDAETAVMDVQKAIDAIVGKLPTDATRPIVRKYSLGSRPILNLSLSGPYPYEELKARADDLQVAIENVNGVGQVSLVGAPARELQISLDRDALESYGIGVQVVAGMLRANNLNVPAGILRQGAVQRTVRVTGEFASADEVRALLVPLPRGGSVPLGELAQIRFGYPEDSSVVRMDGKSAIGLLVVKTSDANVVATTRRIEKVLDEQRQALPAGMEIRVASDETTFIDSSLSETMRDLLLGIATTALVLVLFLREWRSSLIVLVAIPTSLISTFFMMFILHFTLNIVSTMALALCIGILVDDSIVVLENIHRHQIMGQGPIQAAIEGRREIGMAAIAITLCDVVVFAPVAFLSDLVGQFFRQFGLTVVCATLFSLFVSFTLTPALASRLTGKEGGRRRKGFRARQAEVAAPAPAAEGKADEAIVKPAKVPLFDRTVKAGYRRALAWALGHRGLVIASVALLFAGSIAMIPLGAVATEFMPPFDQGKLVVDLSLDAGTSLAVTDARIKSVEAHLFAMPETLQVFSQIGEDQGANYAQLTVRLKDKSKRSKSQSAVARSLREWGSAQPGISFSVTEPSIVGQTSAEGTKPLIVNVSGPDRLVLAELASRLEAIVKSTPGAVDVDNSMRSRRTELTVAVDRLALSQYGLAAADVASALRTALAGSAAGVLRVAGDEYDIVLRFDPARLRSPRDIESIKVQGQSGILVPVGVIATIGRGDAANSLAREDRQDVATVAANLEGRPLGAVTAEIRKKLEADPAPRGYSFKFMGDTQMMSDSFGSLGWALAGSIALVYLILLVLYDSFLTPVIRMLSLPAGIIGGLGALALTGKAINIISFIGIIMLDGLASKNGTLLIDYTNTLMKRGLPIREAVAQSGETRLRPIVMTSMTMIFGMLPLALATGSSSEMKSSMAILLIGGLVTSTLISPILLPVVYTLIDDARIKRRARLAQMEESR
jgi:hydrophobic/amphiphilic exporter-1 (mainly G- bacteria), HAE1 family